MSEVKFMEQLFAVRVLVHYYDKPKVDHAAIRRLLSAAAVDSLELVLSDGATVPLSLYIDTPPVSRLLISHVIESSGSSLVQVATVFMLAEARAAADAICTSPNELETACIALERLLGGLIDIHPRFPVRDINLSTRLKLGTFTRHRALSQTSSTLDNHASILKAVNAVLRLCDVATHCLAVVSRQCISTSATSEIAVNLSSRLLMLSASLYEAQRSQCNPALSFFSSNSLRTALVSGALHLGAITMEHLNIEPMSWIHTANHIVMSSISPPPPRTSIITALLGGMLKGAKAYETCERDLVAAKRAVLLFSTLHVVLETDLSRGSHNYCRDTEYSTESKSAVEAAGVYEGVSSSPGTISQAARSFLGERVVAAEEDGDEGRIAARTVYQACEEYAERSGETEGLIGLLSRLFEAAGRHLNAEFAEETIVSLSDANLNLSCPPDESDASSDGQNVRSEGSLFHMDVFDSKGRDGHASVHSAVSHVDDVPESVERLELHRQIGALALDTLSHWINESRMSRRYSNFDILDFTVTICRSASLFCLTESHASYDLHSAMLDFGSMLYPAIEQRVSKFPEISRQGKWRDFILSLIQVCQKPNPILSNILSSCENEGVILSLQESFLNMGTAIEASQNKFHGLPPESILQYLLSAISPATSLLVVKRFVDFLKAEADVDCSCINIMSHRAACFIILSYATYVFFGLEKTVAKKARKALVSLYSLSGESNYDIDPVISKDHLDRGSTSSGVSVSNETETICDLLSNVLMLMETVCKRSGVLFNLSPPARVQGDCEASDSDTPYSSSRRQMVGYHLLRSFMMTHHALNLAESASSLTLVAKPSREAINDATGLASVVCIRSTISREQCALLTSILESRDEPLDSYMFIAECVALLHIRGPTKSISEGLPLLTFLTKNFMDVISSSISSDLDVNFLKLHEKLRETSLCCHVVGSEKLTSNHWELALGTSVSLKSTFLQLAMSYIRRPRNDAVSEIGFHIVAIATELLDYISDSELKSGKDILFDVLNVLLFIPDSLAELSSAIVLFVERYLSVIFSESDYAHVGFRDALSFMSSVCGLVELVRRGSDSASEVRSLCKFAVDISKDPSINKTVLAASFYPEQVPDNFGSIGKWLRSSLPRISLKKLLTCLLASTDDSAVTVSALSESLSLLIEACMHSDVWRTGVLSALKELVSFEGRFSDHLLYRSVIQSATMHDAVIALFERVVGSSASKDSLVILERCFDASQELLKREDVMTFEGRVRLLDFIVRVALLHGHICASRNEKSFHFVEESLFSLLFYVLEKANSILRQNASDEVWKQTALFVSSLLNSAHVAFFESCPSLFDHIEDSVLAESSSEPQSNLKTSRTDSVCSVNRGSVDISNCPPSNSEDNLISALCTYTTTGDQYVEQHWYFCYSCDLAGSDGVCSICARVCHKGCELAYSKFSRFFCDCGHGSDKKTEGTGFSQPSEDSSHSGGSQKAKTVHIKRRKPCICLKRQSHGESKPKSQCQQIVPKASHHDLSNERTLLVGNMLRKTLLEKLKDMHSDGSPSAMQGRFKYLQTSFSHLLQDRDVVKCLLNVALFFIRNLEGDESMKFSPCTWVSKTAKADLMRLVTNIFSDEAFMRTSSVGKKVKCQKILKSGSFEASPPNTSCSISRHSLLSYSPYHKVVVASGKSGIIEFADISDIIATNEPAQEKSVTASFGRTCISYVANSISFHPENSNIILICGESRVSVLYRVDDSASMWRHLNIEIGLTEFDGYNGANNLVSARWIPGETSLMLVTSENFVKIFDIAVDTFCPCFYAKIPASDETQDAKVEEGPDFYKQSNVRVKKLDCSSPLIVSSCVVRNTLNENFVRDFILLLLTSDGDLYLTRTKTNESIAPSFSYCFNVSARNIQGDESVQITYMTYLSHQSLLVVTYDNGALLLMSFVIKFDDLDVHIGLEFAHIYKEALPSGELIDIEPIPGPNRRLLFFQKNRSLSNCGVISLHSDFDVEVNYFTGNSSSSVLGVSYFSPLTADGDTTERGAVVLLDDGSLYRLFIPGEFGHPQCSESFLLAEIADRRSKRGAQLCESLSGDEENYSPIPDPIGYFEKSRLVTEQITIEGVEGSSDSGMNYERIGAILAGESGECVVSTGENQPFRFSASIANKSLVLVGARLRFGGTERSRYRVPSEIRVFGRKAKSLTKNGVKRWVDIPFSVPESTNSPRKVIIELIPRRFPGETRQGSNGLVAIDCLDLHAVSDVEYTERKLAFEAEKTKYAELLKKKRENTNIDQIGDSCFFYPPHLNTSDAIENNFKFSFEQASLLAVVELVGRYHSSLPGEGERLLFEVNGLWAAPPDGMSLRDPQFLKSLLGSCLVLTSCQDSPGSNICRPDQSTSPVIANSTLPALAAGTRRVILENIMGYYEQGVCPSIEEVEKYLFSLGSVLRSLFSHTCFSGLTLSQWCEEFDKNTPPTAVVAFLLRTHINLGRKGRVLYRSLERANLSAVDIAIFQSIRDLQLHDNSQFIKALVEMLCNHDQLLRLSTGQRLLDVFDSLDGSTQFCGSPFESEGFCAQLEAVKSDLSMSQDTITIPASEENPENNQSWAYRCDSCGEVCNSEWWHCNDCEDFDLCTECLRGSSEAFHGSHQDHHILLRGTVEEDITDQNSTETRHELGDVILAMQKTMVPLINQVLDEMNVSQTVHKWLFLDAAETVTQLLGSQSPRELREVRLSCLFESAYPDALKAEIKSFAAEISSSNESLLLHESSSSSYIGSGITLLLLLRILVCSNGGTMPLHIHNHHIPSVLTDLLSRMHRRLRDLICDTRNPHDHPIEVHAARGVMDAAVWNENVPGFSYDLLTFPGDSKSFRSFADFETFIIGSDSPRMIFLAILNEILQVMDYAYRAASSCRISDEMDKIPRNVLCDIINSCETYCSQNSETSTFSRVESSATQLLSTLCFENDDLLNETLDKFLYEEQAKRLREALATVENLHNINGYHALVNIADIVENLHKAAYRHPKTWRKFAGQREDAVHDIYFAAKLFDGEVQVHALQLLAAGLSVSIELSSRVIRGLPISEFEFEPQSSSLREANSLGLTKGEKADTATSKECWTFSELVRAGRGGGRDLEKLISYNNFEIVDFLISKVMLKSQEKLSRQAASQVVMFALSVLAAFRDDSSPMLKAVDDALLSGLEHMQFSGELADGLMHCICFYINCCQENVFGHMSTSMLSSFTAKVMTLFRERCTLFIAHPNARLYCQLSEVVDLGGYYLEADPCTACATATWEASTRQDHRLDMVRAETKYTDSSIMHRLISPHEIYSVSVKVIDPRRTRRAKKIDVSYSTRSLSDAAELKSLNHPWQPLNSLYLGPSATEATVTLTVPIAIANVKFEFVEFHNFSESAAVEPIGTRGTSVISRDGGGTRRNVSGRAAENLQCPRCSRSVTDRHGICRNCHENAYQCRQCRNINYENLDGFLCNECGYCKHGRFEFCVNGRATHVAEPIRNEDDRKRASKTIEKETVTVHRCMEQLSLNRSSIIKSLISRAPSEDPINRSRTIISSRIGIADILDSVAPRSDIAVLEALLQGRVGQEVEDASHVIHGVNVAEESLAEGSSSDAHERDHSHRSGSNVASPTNRSNQSEATTKIARPESTGFNKVASSLATKYSNDCKSAFTTLCRGIRLLTITRAELVQYANRVGGDRLSEIKQMSSGDQTWDSLKENESKENGEAVGVQMASCCYRCTQSFIAKSVHLLQNIMKRDGPASRLIRSSSLAKSMLLICSLCERRDIQDDIRDLLTLIVNDNIHATRLVCEELGRKIGFCIESYETVDAHSIARLEMAVLEATAMLDDSCWEERLKLVIRILFKASTSALTCSSIAESIIRPCLRIALQLTRTDSELTIIEPRAALEIAEVVADDAVESDHPIEQLDVSTVENDDMESTRQTGSAFQENLVGDGEVSSRPYTLHPDLIRMFGHDVSEGESMPLSMNAPSSQRDSSRNEDRRMHARYGPDGTDGSRAPSSIGTAFEGHVSDEEMDVPHEQLERKVNFENVKNILEKDHDGGRLSANIAHWLDGKQSHSIWIADMTARVHDNYEERDRSILSMDGYTQPSAKVILRHWRSLSRKPYSQISDAQVFSENLSSPIFIDKGNWLVRLMLFTPCTTVRKEAGDLLQLLCGQEEALQLQLLDVLTGPSLSLGASAGENSAEFFDLLEMTLSSKRHRLYLIGEGFLFRLAILIYAKAELLIRCEAEADASYGMVNFMEGYALKRLVSLLRLTLEVIPSKHFALRKKILERGDNKIVKCLQRSYLYVRKLISLKTRLTDECAAQLGTILLSKDFLFNGMTVTAIVSACVLELKAANRRNDAQGIAILLEELCQMLCPERKKPTCLISLNKAPTQEEFIRGSMSRNPYSSASFDGPLMRDVKNKICQDLDLPGLLEDDFAMELLVAGNVVKLDLPIMAVYEHVWRGAAAAQSLSNTQPTHLSRTLGLRRAHGHSRGNGSVLRGENNRTLLNFRRVISERDGFEDNSRSSESRVEPPMVIIYRLSGLDGEATEPIVDSLPSIADNEQSSEELYRDTVVLGRVGGFDVLFQLLSVVGSWGDDAETAVRAPALRLLRASCEVTQNRAMLAKSPNAVSTLLDCASLAFEHVQGSPAAVASAESLLIAAEQILAQQRRDTGAETLANTVHLRSLDPVEVTSRVEAFLERLEGTTSSTAEYSILHLLPFLVQGIKNAIDLVLEHIRFSWDAIDYASSEQRKARQLGTILFATPTDLHGNAFASQTIRAGIAEKAVQYITSKFPLPRKLHTTEWNDALEEEAVPLVLKVLTGLSLFLDRDIEEAGQLLMAIIQRHNKIIPVLTQLEMAVSDNSVGTCAEEFLEGLSRNSNIEAQINEERETIKKARREAARASRAAIMHEAGLSTFDTREKAITTQFKNTNTAGDNNENSDEPNSETSILRMMEDLPDEIGPACVVCGDGFRCRPEEALTLYVFCKKMPLELCARSATDSGPGKTADGTSSQSVSRLEWDVWSAGRSRGHNNNGSRSGVSCCFTSVTHMNAIHVGCHREAARVDRTSRRDEWDGASLRNSQTRCNNLFPVRPPITLFERHETGAESKVNQARTSYGGAVEGYFSRLSSVGRTTLSQTKIVMFDLGRCLLRFSDGGTSIFSEFSKGGGAHSNASFIPHLVQLAIFTMEESSNIRDRIDTSANQANIQTQRAAMTKYLEENEVGDVTYYLASSVVLLDFAEWYTSMGAFLRRGLRDGVLESRQVLRLIAFIDVVNHALKHGVVVNEERSWIDALSRHIGLDETFADRFGDLVSEHWESHVRKIETTEDFVNAIRKNASNIKCDGEVENENLILQLKEIIRKE